MESRADRQRKQDREEWDKALREVKVISTVLVTRTIAILTGIYHDLASVGEIGFKRWLGVNYGEYETFLQARVRYRRGIYWIAKMVFNGNMRLYDVEMAIKMSRNANNHRNGMTSSRPDLRILVTFGLLS
ncbi:hypothetical protein KIN20_017876 [Parelaphostrongylus tenuis]|uniref:Uncharacterized protein n=1 Tax=Parelaphostrongylus tenuis TaxID=148309 RepID=A0AAD5N2Y4_PARTN|nr:hypothetical protein KIN20_017876 [Parelaphostrongylus tenuis]